MSKRGWAFMRIRNNPLDSVCLHKLENGCGNGTELRALWSRNLNNDQPLKSSKNWKSISRSLRTKFWVIRLSTHRLVLEWRQQKRFSEKKICSSHIVNVLSIFFMSNVIYGHRQYYWHIESIDIIVWKKKNDKMFASKEDVRLKDALDKISKAGCRYSFHSAVFLFIASQWSNWLDEISSEFGSNTKFARLRQNQINRCPPKFIAPKIYKCVHNTHACHSRVDILARVFTLLLFVTWMIFQSSTRCIYIDNFPHFACKRWVCPAFTFNDSVLLSLSLLNTQSFCYIFVLNVHINVCFLNIMMSLLPMPMYSLPLLFFSFPAESRLPLDSVFSRSIEIEIFL